MCNHLWQSLSHLIVHMHNTLTHTWHAAILFVVIPTYQYTSIVEILSTIIMYHCCIYFTIHEIHLFTCVDSSSPVTTTPVQASESYCGCCWFFRTIKKTTFLPGIAICTCAFCSLLLLLKLNQFQNRISIVKLSFNYFRIIIENQSV